LHENGVCRRERLCDVHHISAINVSVEKRFTPFDSNGNIQFGGEQFGRKLRYEIWAFDIAARKRVARLPGHNAIALVAVQGTAPRLVALDAAKMGLVLVDAGAKPRVISRIDGVADSASQLELH